MWEFLAGQGFFVLGLVVVLRLRPHSRLTLARHVPLLAVFGFALAIGRWMELLDVTDFLWLGLVRLVFTSIGLIALLEFGLRLSWPAEATIRRVRLIRFGIAGLVIGLVVTVGQSGEPLSQAQWTLEWLLRLSLALPGGLLAGYGLRRFTREELEPWLQPRIGAALRLLGLSMAGYSLVAGLLVPLNGLISNRDILDPWLAAILAVVSLILSIFVFWGLQVFTLETERDLAEAEQRQAIAADRERIGAELNDRVIQSIFGAGLILGLVRQSLRHNPDRAEVDLDGVIGQLNRVIAETRRYILHLQPSGENMQGDLESLLTDLRRTAQVETELNIDLGDMTLPGEARQQLLMIIQEALSNVGRHSQAQHVVVDLLREDGHLWLRIADDGVGLTPKRSGRGIEEIRRGVGLLGGEFDMRSVPGRGTALEVRIPLVRLETTIS